MEKCEKGKAAQGSRGHGGLIWRQTLGLVDLLLVGEIRLFPTHRKVI